MYAYNEKESRSIDVVGKLVSPCFKCACRWARFIRYRYVYMCFTGYSLHCQETN
jgi:hypothetical protein